MDPLSALAVAAGAVQFLDFGTRLITGTVERYQSTAGATEHHLEIEALAEQINELAGCLSPSPEEHSNPAEASSSDKQLRKIVHECRNVAAQLLQILADLKSKGRKTLVDSLMATAKAIRKDSKVRNLHKKILSCQTQLSCCLVTMI